MASFNKVILVGNLTRDVEIRHIPSGQAVADIGIAVNEKWTAKDGTKKETVSFIDCTLWGRTAEVAGEYLSKGSSVLVEGKLVQDTWEDKESGQKRSKLKVNVDHMQFLSSKRGDSAPSQRQESTPDYSSFDQTEADAVF